MNEKIRVLIVEPEKAPYESEIESSLTAMQTVVGGMIQAVYPFEEPVALVCNDEGKLLGMPLHRGLFMENILYDVIAGTFLICGAPPDSDHFTSLTNEQISCFRERFRYSERFIRVNGKIFCLREEAIHAEGSVF